MRGSTLTKEQRRVLGVMREQPDKAVSAQAVKARVLTLDNLMRLGMVTCRLGGNHDLLHPHKNYFYKLTEKGKTVELNGEGG